MMELTDRVLMVLSKSFLLRGNNTVASRRRDAEKPITLLDFNEGLGNVTKQFILPIHFHGYGRKGVELGAHL
ncbi:Amino-acid N-acetyltransferase subunit Mak10 [Colletotrichum sp. SAR11_59]|nr:Amino-acid N-acetyltransferase subunit Mak10 [Colletotrichum sp. SAR11_59]